MSAEQFGRVTTPRTDYRRGSLDESDAGPDPFELFRQWFEAAGEAMPRDPNAMTLATADESGRPTARIVLLKSYDHRGFVFFTNYLSRKGRELARQPAACLLFFWPPLERQVRIDGVVGKVDAAESDEYFPQRPLESRLGALASPQSQAIASREVLENRLAELRLSYPGTAGPPRPDHWGGYRLVPDEFEFWQGRSSRLHDRLRYRRAPDGWSRDRLAP